MLMTYLKELCALCGISGDEGAVRDYLQEKIRDFPGILDMKTDALGNLLVQKQGKAPAKHTVLIGAHMDEVGLIITDVQKDGLCTVDAVGGVDADAVIGRAVHVPGVGLGVIGAAPIHKLKGDAKDKKPAMRDLRLDLGARSFAETSKLVQPGASVCFHSEWTELGGGPVVPFMDRRTIYDKGLYRAAFEEAERLGIPCQTKTRIAGGNDAGSVSQTRDGAKTLAISIPCRYLHTPYTVAQVSDMEQSLQLAKAMLSRLHEAEV